MEGTSEWEANLVAANGGTRLFMGEDHQGKGSSTPGRTSTRVLEYLVCYHAIVCRCVSLDMV